MALRLSRIIICIAVVLNMCLSQRPDIRNSIMPASSIQFSQNNGGINRNVQGLSRYSIGTVGRLVPKKRKKRTFKQIVQENIVEDIVHLLLKWKQCEVTVDKTMSSFVTSSPFLALTIEKICSSQFHKLTSPVFNVFLKPIYDDIERRVGPEAEEMRRRSLYSAYRVQS